MRKDAHWRWLAPRGISAEILLWLLTAFAFLLALGAECARADNVQDLRQWPTLGLPIAAEWNVDGFAGWHVQQVQEGRRLLPSIRVPQYAPPGTPGMNANNPKPTATILDSFGDWEFVRSRKVPLCLRTNNICSVFADARYRPPAVAEIENSPVVWRYAADGSLDTRPLVDPFGADDNWSAEGQLWGRSHFLTELQARYPQPPFLLLVENNEGPYFNPKLAADPKTGAWLEPLDAHSIRLAEYVATHGASLAEFWPVLYQRRAEQYKALFAAFDEALSRGWQGKTYTAAYGATKSTPGPSEADCYDAGSPSVAYIGGGARSNFTALTHGDILRYDAVWTARREANPRAYREISLTIGRSGATNGAAAGKHEVITPARWQGYCEYLLWAMRAESGGVPVLLRHYVGTRSRPDDAFGVEPYTEGDYARAVVAACDFVCEQKTLRHWYRGATALRVEQGPYGRLLTCDVNTPRGQWIDPKKGKVSAEAEIQVWCLGFELRGNTLLVVWSPCVLDDTFLVDVPGRGTFELMPPAEGADYWMLWANNDSPERLGG